MIGKNTYMFSGFHATKKWVLLDGSPAPGWTSCQAVGTSSRSLAIRVCLLYMMYYWNLKICRSLWPAENESCRSHMKSCRTVTDDRRLFHALPILISHALIRCFCGLGDVKNSGFNFNFFITLSALVWRPYIGVISR